MVVRLAQAWSCAIGFSSVEGSPQEAYAGWPDHMR